MLELSRVLDQIKPGERIDIQVDGVGLIHDEGEDSYKIRWSLSAVSTEGSCPSSRSIWAKETMIPIRIGERFLPKDNLPKEIVLVFGTLLRHQVHRGTQAVSMDAMEKLVEWGLL